jgi:hypothetical protein
MGLAGGQHEERLEGYFLEAMHFFFLGRANEIYYFMILIHFDLQLTLIL